ncbi:MAG TPA: hypothetical protein VH087_04720, partial [Thermoanaerobaculia bacterium]|nr:hypothetical protein [Thermoanaerobaculia bacterium]
GNCERRLGHTAQAEALFRQAEKLHSGGWIPTYNRACLLASTGHPEESLAILQTLVGLHPMSAPLVEHDPDLVSVRALPGYAALRKSLRPDVDPSAAEDDAE